MWYMYLFLSWWIPSLFLCSRGSRSIVVVSLLTMFFMLGGAPGRISVSVPAPVSVLLVSAQERPTYTTRQFTNITHRTNLCHLNHRLILGETDLKNAIEGMNITVGIVDQLNNLFIRFDSDGRLLHDDPGIFPIILDELARRAGFQWRHSFARVLPPHAEVNKNLSVSWTDVLTDAVYRYDFSFAEWVHNLERRQLGVGFPAGWFDASTILIQASRATNPEFTITNFLKPFSEVVWGLICCLLLVSSIVFFVLGWLQEEQSTFTGHHIFFAVMAFTTNHAEWSPTTASQRLFSFSLSFWVLIMASAYTANLASFLVADRSPAFVPITLAEAEQSGVSVCVRANAAVFHQISAKYPALPLIVDPDFTKTYQMLREGKCQVLAARAADWSKFSRDALVNGDCQLQWIGRAEQINGGGAATKVDSGEYCTSILTHVLDIHFNEMIDTGFIEHAWNAHLDTLSSHNCANGETAFEIEEENDGRLRPVDVGGIFVIHGMCCFVAILLGVGERFRKRRRQQKRGLKKQDGIMNDHSGTDELELERMDGIASQPLSGTLADDHGDEREDDISVTPNYGEDDVMVEEAVAVLQQYLMKKRTGSRHISTSHGSRMSLEMR